MKTLVVVRSKGPGAEGSQFALRSGLPACVSGSRELTRRRAR